MQKSVERCNSDFIHWGDNYLLGYKPMDDVHAEFVHLIGALQCGDEVQLLPTLKLLELHTQAHFELENQYMRETGFPALDCHIDEHAAVLKSIQDVRDLTENGDFNVCRRLANSLADWFPAHADYLDSALAHWMCKQSLGGKPVVLRRDVNLR